MPEGHTIHRLAAEHKRIFAGKVIRASSPQGRFTDGAALIDGRVLEATEAYGKHLFHRYAGDLWLHVHLGLYGGFVAGPVPAPQPRGALRLRIVAGGHFADLRGPTACELITPAERAAIRARLGPDPLRRGADPDRAWTLISRSRAPIGQLLMDQRVVAGVGNVYRAEVLFRQRVDPFLPGRKLPHERWLACWADVVTLMRAGVRAGRIVTTRTVHRDEGRYVYRRTGLPCLICGTPIRTQVLGARNLYWCPACQPPGAAG